MVDYTAVTQHRQVALLNIERMRAFGRLRRILESHEELARQLSELEKRYDAQFKVVFDAIRELISPEPMPTRKIGFGVDDA